MADGGQRGCQDCEDRGNMCRGGFRVGWRSTEKGGWEKVFSRGNRKFTLGRRAPGLGRVRKELTQ